MRSNLFASSFLVLAAAGAACSTSPSAVTKVDGPSSFADRDPASETVSGIAQIDYEYPHEARIPSYTSARKISASRPGDTSQYYYVTKANGMNPHMGDRLARIYSKNGDPGECTIASSVTDFKVVTNPASRFTALYVQDGSLYGVYASKEYPPEYQYSPYCLAGPSKTDWLGGTVVQIAGKSQFWTYLPGPGEDPETSLAFFLLAANPSINITFYSGDGQKSSDGVIDQVVLNPCFQVKGKPYNSFVAFTHYKNDRRVACIDPAHPHDSPKNRTPNDVGTIASFMLKQKISADGGKTCQ
jgi:hypothetical protein